MELRPLGRSGLFVSAFGLGCGNFGGIGSAPAFFGQGESEAEAFDLLDRAVDLGINYLDTADAYGGGRSEQAIAAWLAARGPSMRDRVLISTKVGNAVGSELDRSGLSPAHITRQVDESLRQLGVDHLDMYLVHEQDSSVPLADVVGAFDAAVQAGKVRAIGISNHSPKQVEEALRIADERGQTRFEWVQNGYSLLDQATEAKMLALCASEGLGFTPFGPLCGGLLTGKYRLDGEYPEGARMTMRPEPYLHLFTELVFGAVDRLADAAADLGISTAGLALAWLHHHHQVTSPILGPRRPDHFTPMTEAIETTLTPYQHAEIGSWFAAQEQELRL